MPTSTSNVFCRVNRRRPCRICGKPDWRSHYVEFQALIYSQTFLALGAGVFPTLCPFGERAWRRQRSAGSAWLKSRLATERTQLPKVDGQCVPLGSGLGSGFSSVKPASQFNAGGVLPQPEAL